MSHRSNRSEKVIWFEAIKSHNGLNDCDNKTNFRTWIIYF